MVSVLSEFHRHCVDQNNNISKQTNKLIVKRKMKMHFTSGRLHSGGKANHAAGGIADVKLSPYQYSKKENLLADPTTVRPRYFEPDEMLENQFNFYVYIY